MPRRRESGTWIERPEKITSAALDAGAERCRIETWLADLESRFLTQLTFAELRRSVQSLSEDYVRRRGRLPTGEALAGPGKRAAFAVFFGPLHYILLREVVRALGGPGASAEAITDLGCGTGVGGAAWAMETHSASVYGVDRQRWALEEAVRTWRALEIRGRTVREDLSRTRMPRPGGSVLAAFCLNELSRTARDALVDRLLQAAQEGSRILVVEPIAKNAVPWWSWVEARFVEAGGRSDEWKFRARLPELQERLSRAAGMDHRCLSARTLYLPGRRS